MSDFLSRISTLLNNLKTTVEYLVTSQSDIQYRDRLWTVAQDTVNLNSLCEFAGEGKLFVAGVLSNKIAKKYIYEAIDNKWTQNS